MPSVSLSTGKRQGDERSHEQLRRTGICSVVDAGGVSEGVEEQRHNRTGGGDERNYRNGHALAAMEDAPCGHEHERPDNVELHDDAEIPQVRERRGESRCRKVGNLSEDVRPVSKEERRRQGVCLDLGQKAREHEIGAGCRERNDHKYGRKQARDSFEQVAGIAEVAVLE